MITNWLFRILTLAAMAILVVIYFQPIWWVSLKAPNYPPEAFPDGVRIHFHMDGVFNGCQKRTTKELNEFEALNCRHEMDTINHYVGMYPISAGAPIERTLSCFLFAFMLVLLSAFMMPTKSSQVSTLTIGFLGIIIWMGIAFFMEGGINYFSNGYIASLQESLELDRKDIQNWSGLQALLENYKDTLGIYFREPVEIAKRVEFLEMAFFTLSIALVVAMIIFIVGVGFSRLFYWLLVLVPIFLPVFFILDYAGWLWWFGHTLNDMGAFTVKPFMPTVFGQGKVAQFTTYSYPYYGFFLMLISTALLIFAALFRKKQLKSENNA
ncbi:MAG: hypothetical protein RIT27_1382 [Pseudomonadota bacterium]|jgi:hypothetical protein